MWGNCSSTKIGIKLELSIPAYQPAPTASVIHLWDGKRAVTKSKL